jgi:hypothetical protein
MIAANDRAAARFRARARRTGSDEPSGTLDEALSRAEGGGCCWWDPELRRMRAMLATEAGDAARAREELLRAIAIAEVQRSEAMRRRAAADLARVR